MELVAKLESRRNELKSRELKVLEEISDSKKQVTAKEESSNTLLIKLDKYKSKQLKLDSEIAESHQKTSDLRINIDELNIASTFFNKSSS